MKNKEQLKSYILMYPTISNAAHNVLDWSRILMQHFSKNYSLYSTNDDLSCNPFFIVGSGRSGTTLLRAILARSPEIVIPPESYVIPEVIRKFRSLRMLQWDDKVKLVIGSFEQHPEFSYWDLNTTNLYRDLANLADNQRSLAKILDELYRLYATVHKPTARIWGDKTPRNTLYLRWVASVFPKAKYIHLVRDGRDVVASYLKAGIYSNVESACTRWIQSVRVASNHQKRTDQSQFLEIRYEDLVNQPGQLAGTICDYLGINFDQDMLNHTASVLELGDTVMTHHKNLIKPINENSIGKWQSDLTEDEKLKVQDLLSAQLQRFRYI